MSALARVAVTRTEDVRDLACCSEAEAEHWAQRVITLREHWTQRHPQAPFFTLGAPSYLDGQAGCDRHYRERAAALNPVLEQHFAPLLARIIDVVGEALGIAPVTDPDLGLPGFHIFEANPAFARPVASIHVDRQYEQIVWPQGTQIDPRDQWSLTLPLALPRGGGGLRVWPLDSLSLPESAAARRALLAQHQTPLLHSYRVGWMAVHSGHLFHQIAPMAEALPGEVRVTLQAHLLRVNDRWLIYW